jgi:drug/metabolite transporter (DMT)-like permease
MNQIMLRGYLYAAAGAALFSTKAIFIKLAYREEVNAALMLALRMAFSLPFFIGVGVYAVQKLREQGKPLPTRPVWIRAILVGFIGYYLSALLDFEGLVYITAQLERLVLFTYPIFVMFLGAAFFGQRMRAIGLLAAAITYAGLMLVFLVDLPEGGRNTVIGTALVLACAVTFALYQLLAKNIIAAMGSLIFTSVAMSSSAVACIIHYIIVSGSFDFSASPRFVAYAAGTALFATVLPSFLINAGLSRISAQATSMISTFSPILTIALAVAVLGETFTLADAVGSTLVIAGVLLYALTDRKPVAAD